MAYLAREIASRVTSIANLLLRQIALGAEALVRIATPYKFVGDDSGATYDMIGNTDTVSSTGGGASVE